MSPFLPQGWHAFKSLKVAIQCHSWAKKIHNTLNTHSESFKFKEYYLHPGKLTWNLKITCLKRKIIFKTSIIVFHASCFVQISNMLKMSSLPFPFLLIVKGSVEKWPGFLEPYHSRSHAFHPVIQNCLEKRRYDFKQTDPIFENAWNLDSPFAGKDHITCPTDFREVWNIDSTQKVPLGGDMWSFLGGWKLAKQFSSDQTCTAIAQKKMVPKFWGPTRRSFESFTYFYIYLYTYIFIYIYIYVYIVCIHWYIA